MPQDSNTLPPSSATTTARRITPYVAVWGGLATVSLLYISVAITRPDIFQSSTPDGSLTPVAQTDRSTREQSLEEQQLAEKLAILEREFHQEKVVDHQRDKERKSHLDRIAALEAKAAKAEEDQKNQSTQAAEQDQAPAQPSSEPPVNAASKQAADQIAERIGGAKILNSPEADGASSATKNETTIAKQSVQATPAPQTVAEPKTETTLAKTTPKAAATEPAQKSTAAVSDPPKVTAKQEVKKTAETKQQVAAVPPPPPTKRPAEPTAPKKVAKKKAPAIKTGSIDKAANQPITFGPAVVTRATRPIGIRLATGPSVDSLRLSWSALADRHGATIRQLQPRYVTGIDATGLTYDLVAGPFNTAAEATDVCARLHANGARCALGEFGGNALN